MTGSSNLRFLVCSTASVFLTVGPALAQDKQQVTRDGVAEFQRSIQDYRQAEVKALWYEEGYLRLRTGRAGVLWGYPEEELSEFARFYAQQGRKLKIEQQLLVSSLFDRRGNETFDFGTQLNPKFEILKNEVERYGAYIYGHLLQSLRDRLSRDLSDSPRGSPAAARREWIQAQWSDSADRLMKRVTLSELRDRQLTALFGMTETARGIWHGDGLPSVPKGRVGKLIFPYRGTPAVRNNSPMLEWVESLGLMELIERDAVTEKNARLILSALDFRLHKSGEAWDTATDAVLRSSQPHLRPLAYIVPSGHREYVYWNNTRLLAQLTWLGELMAKSVPK